MTEALAAGLELLDEGECRVWWAERWHPRGPRCPHCGAKITGQPAATWWRGGRVHCNCGRWCTWRTGTVAHGSTLTARQLYLCAMLTEAGAARALIAGACQMSTDTVRVWQQRWAAA